MFSRSHLIIFVNRLIMDLNKLPLTLLPIAGERVFMR